MHSLRPATAAVMAFASLVSCAASRPGPALLEYRWALAHGACECGPASYATGGLLPYGGQRVDDYARRHAAACKSRQFVVTAFGDGTADVDGDVKLAQERAVPFTRSLGRVADARVDTIAFGGHGVAHASTLEILCPTERIPPQTSF